jgi:hypothetical protein
MITISQQGDFSNLDNFLERCLDAMDFSILDKYGAQGVAALSAATPVDSGKTASSWGYYTTRSKDTVSIVFTNSNLTDNGTPVAILLQYGHATRDGGFVQGIDYINPALRPIMEEIADAAWEEVTK